MPGDLQLRLDTHGAEHRSAAISGEELAALQALADSVLVGRAGVRVFGHESIDHVLGPQGSVGRLAMAHLGEAAQPVRAILFDKTANNNWSVGWHQDRTIAVRERRDVPGFGPWSTKAGVVHVEPPFEIIAGMITIRVHIDDCGPDNAPLLIAPGSHRMGRIPAGEIAEIVRRLGHEACFAKPGDVWTYATSIIHASERAQTPRHRRVLQIDYASTTLPRGLEWLGVLH